MHVYINRYENSLRHFEVVFAKKKKKISVWKSAFLFAAISLLLLSAAPLNEMQLSLQTAELDRIH